MVTAIAKYKCDKCETVYDTNQEASDCEGKHVLKSEIGILDFKFKRFAIWPAIIQLDESQTGTTAKYKLDYSSI